MPKYKQKHKDHYDCPDSGDIADADAETQAKLPKRDLEPLDDLLDEIDKVLEKNAEEFVKGYVQKGGE